MEKNWISAVLILVFTGYVVGESDDGLACCPPSYFLLKTECWNPESNVTKSIRPACKDFFRIPKFDVKNGKLVVQLNELYSERFDASIACYGNATKDRNLTKFRPMAILCVTEEEEESVIDDTTLGYCMIVSVVFLVITTIIYTVFSELRDLFGKSVINFCGSLAIGLGILSIMKLMVYENMTACAIRGFLAYFFLMAAFFWTNSISIQVLRDSRRPTSVDYGWREFRWYMLYSWGLPTILTTIMAIVNYHPGDHERPGIGLNHCWFFGKTQQWQYMYSVMTILLLTNFAIFLYIATMVWKFSFQSNHIKALKFKLSMTIRLIVLMGLPWIFEMISSAVQGRQYVILAIVDLINCLQGILIFIVLVIRKRVVKIMHQRGLLDWCSGPVERWLAVGDDAETNVVQHTDVPLQDDHINGHIRKT